MPVSNTDMLKLLLLPGSAEILQEGNTSNNLIIYGLAKDIQFARNALHIGIAITIIASLSSIYSSHENNTANHHTYLSIVGVGVGTTILAAKKLLDASLFIKQLLQAETQPIDMRVSFIK